jgi:hypothetical protein
MALTPSEQLFLAREVEHLQERVLDRRRKPLNSLTLFPANTDPDPDAKTYTVRMKTSHGRAKIVNERGDDLPPVGVGITSVTHKIERIGVGCGWTIFDIRRAMTRGIPLEGWVVEEAERAVAETRNDIHWYGDTAYQLFGVLTNPYIPRVPLASISMATTVADLIAWALSIATAGEALHGVQDWSPNHIGLATTLFNTLSLKYLGDNGRTVLQYLQDAFSARGRPVQFHSIRELNGAGPNGENLVFAWNDDPDVISPTVPGGEYFEQLAPESVPGTFKVVCPCWGTTGGVATYRPTEAVIGIVASS